jgi:hypothetical protein
MEFEPLSAAIKEEWDQIVHQSDDGWLFSLTDWLEMVSSVWDMENLSFAVRLNGKIVAVMPLHWIKAAHTVASGGWGYGGPAIKAGIPEGERRRIWEVIFAHVRERAAELGATKTSVSISPITHTSLNNRWGVNPLVEFGFADVSTHSWITPLSQSETELWNGLSENARWEIRQARKAGYTVRQCLWREMVDEYYRVHAENYQRTGVKPHPKAYFEGIADQQSDQYILWTGFDVQGRPVAFHNSARFKGAALYHTGCSETAHLKSGVNYWLFWEAVRGAKGDGCEWYEAGEAFPLARSGKEKGLTDFKRKFGGELHRVFRGEITREVPQPIAPAAPATPAAPVVSVLGRRTALRNWLKASRDLLKAIGR